MRAGIVRALFAATIATIAGGAACSYSPNPESGKLMCGPSSSCPENYSCRANYCWRDGDVTGGGGRGGGGGAAGGSAGMGGAAGGAPNAKFVGRWDWVSPAKRTRVCPGFNPETLNLPVDASDFIDVSAVVGSTSALIAFYYCDWNLDVNAAGTTATIRAGQSCMAVDTSVVPPVTYTWTGTSFTLTSSDGRSGTVEASIPYAYTSTSGTGSCMVTFSGPVMKN